jgi:hypothetical protein
LKKGEKGGFKIPLNLPLRKGEVCEALNRKEIRGLRSVCLAPLIIISKLLQILNLPEFSFYSTFITTLGRRLTTSRRWRWGRLLLLLLLTVNSLPDFL